jgi:hypothetical protein
MPLAGKQLIWLVRTVKQHFSVAAHFIVMDLPSSAVAMHILFLGFFAASAVEPSGKARASPRTHPAIVMKRSMQNSPLLDKYNTHERSGTAASP